MEEMTIDELEFFLEQDRIALEKMMERLNLLISDRRYVEGKIRLLTKSIADLRKEILNRSDEWFIGDENNGQS